MTPTFNPQATNPQATNPQAATAHSASRLTDSLDAAVDAIVTNCPGAINLAAPLGLGKPHLLLNALYDRVAADPAKQLNIYTALSLSPPVGKSDLEQRFLAPFVARVYGEDFPRLKYADANAANALPDNIHVEEFYMQSGALLGSQSAQVNYASLNYTHVADALATRGVNVLVQKLATDGQGNYSLSCNTDLSLDVLDAIAATGAPKPFCVGEVDPALPFVGGSALAAPDMFDVIITPKNPHPKLFALPRQPVGDVDYAIGLYASTLVKDGGTIQIGIGALADALCHALVLRHTDNTAYKKVLRALDLNLENHPTVKAYGGLEPFTQGLYGCSEMVNEGFRLLVERGIIRRRVVDDVDVMRRVARSEASASDLAHIEQHGQYLHGAFYLGSLDFYDWVASLSDTKNTLGMQRVSLVNSVTSEHFELEKYQRPHARFFNTCMMATCLGGAASETLPDGRVVSGVGGQYNFVSMGHSLPKAKSVLMLRASRTSGGECKSNILWAVENMTIPRHLRDVYVTEYGIADMRFASDGDCVKHMLSVSDSRFAGALLEAAQQVKKVGEGVHAPTGNTPEHLAQKLHRFRTNGTLPDYPLGSDFTPVEQRIIKALMWLKENTQTKLDVAGKLFDVLTHAVSDMVDEFTQSVEEENLNAEQDALITEAMARMGFDKTMEVKSVKHSVSAELLALALRKTQ